jgi:CspA family cold shock protein
VRRTSLDGRANWFDAKGYGFIGRDGSRDIFAHYTAAVGDGYLTLQEGIPSTSKLHKVPKVRRHPKLLPFRFRSSS